MLVILAAYIQLCILECSCYRLTHTPACMYLFLYSYSLSDFSCMNLRRPQCLLKIQKSLLQNWLSIIYPQGNMETHCKLHQYLHRGEKNILLVYKNIGKELLMHYQNCANTAIPNIVSIIGLDIHFFQTHNLLFYPSYSMRAVVV